MLQGAPYTSIDRFAQLTRTTHSLATRTAALGVAHATRLSCSARDCESALSDAYDSRPDQQLKPPRLVRASPLRAYRIQPNSGANSLLPASLVQCESSIGPPLLVPVRTAHARRQCTRRRSVRHRVRESMAVLPCAADDAT